MTQAPLFWLKKIETALIDMKEIPLWGYPPAFPWEMAASQIGSALQLPEFTIEHSQTQLMKPDAFLSGFGKETVVLSIDLTPLPDAAHWIMAQEDIAKLTQLILNPEGDKKGFSTAAFQEGFYRYLQLQILQVIDQLKAFDDLSLKCAQSESLPSEESLCIDIAIAFESLKLWGRIICPPAFLLGFKSHFSIKNPSLLSFPLTEQVDVDLHLELGKTTLGLPQWESIAIGDCLVLDRSSYDPTTHKGTVTLVLDQQPLFRARLKENHLKIVDYAFYYEEETPMDTHPPDDEHTAPKEEGFEDLSLEADENDPNHMWSAKDASTESTEQLISAREIPLTITVEVSRLKMNLQKLLALKPGNLIELPVRPEQGVDLLVNGKKVAKGELVKLGEVLGVKILQIGS